MSSKGVQMIGGSNPAARQMASILGRIDPPLAQRLI